MSPRSRLVEREKSTLPVTAGIYRYIRHPLYSSLLFLAWGVFFKHLSLPGAGLALVATFFPTLAARMQEVEDPEYFGDVYRDYMSRARMFTPFLL